MAVAAEHHVEAESVTGVRSPEKCFNQLKLMDYQYRYIKFNNGTH
jgi:hypothetical protein